VSGSDASGYVTVVIPIISAIITGVIAVLVTDWKRRKSERDALYVNLTQKYVLQLQYMIESLWWRLDNIVYRDGRGYMEAYEKYKEARTKTESRNSNEYQQKKVEKEQEKKNTYFTISTLYILGSVLAYNRIMLLEGIYAQLEGLSPKHLWLDTLLKSHNTNIVSGN
jgi:hypothetical protein